MMRRPTPHDVAYAWHRDAILGVYGDGLPTHDTPQCGYFKRKLVKGGPYVPARIWLDAEIDDVTGELAGQIENLKRQVAHLQDEVSKAQDEAKRAAVPRLEALAEARLKSAT